MERTAWLQDHRKMRFTGVLERFRRRELSCEEAGELLGMSGRQFRRYCRRYEDEGEEGLLDRRLGRVSDRRAPPSVVEWLEREYRRDHFGWNAKHFHEHLVDQHDFKLSYTWTKLRLQDLGLALRARRRGAHRRKRPRKPCIGMLLHQDGSPFCWLEDQGELDLIVTMDDATSEIYSAFMVDEEGTASSFRGFQEAFSAHGLPGSVYTDRGSHYFLTPEAGGPVDKARLTQVGRALSRLGIEHIPAYSPEARGRSERMFRTLQDRLPKELTLAGIKDVEGANRYIAEVFLPKHNARFAIKPELTESGFVAADPAVLAEILCVEEERTVGRDNTVSWARKRLQLPESPLRRHYVKARVKVRQYPDGALSVVHGQRVIARYTAEGLPDTGQPSIKNAA